LKFGISHLSLVPVRREPADFHEQVNQILFGEKFEILEPYEKWVLVKTDHDGYQGWIDRKQYIPLDEPSYRKYNPLSFGISRSAFSSLTTSIGITSYLSCGSLIPMPENHTFQLGKETYYFRDELIYKPQFDSELLNESIHLFLNTPYQWGGRSILGVDCSGFTQLMFRLMGINLPRDASQQIELGGSISFMEESKMGDLAFFGPEDGRITHVGILMGDNRIAHASGKVKIDWVDHEGIFNRESGIYTHSLRAIKRVIA